MEHVFAAFAALAAGGGAFALLHRIFTPERTAAVAPPRTGGREPRAPSPRATLLTDAVNRVVPQSSADADALRRRLARAGLSMSPSVYHGLTVMLAALVVLSAVTLLPMLGMPFAQTALAGLLAASAALAAPRLVLAYLAGRRADRIRASLPKALDLMAVTVEAGLTMERSMRLYSQEGDGPLEQEFSLVDREIDHRAVHGNEIAGFRLDAAGAQRVFQRLVTVYFQVGSIERYGGRQALHDEVPSNGESGHYEQAGNDSNSAPPRLFGARRSMVTSWFLVGCRIARLLCCVRAGAGGSGTCGLPGVVLVWS